MSADAVFCVENASERPEERVENASSGSRKVSSDQAGGLSPRVTFAGVPTPPLPSPAEGEGTDGAPPTGAPPRAPYRRSRSGGELADDEDEDEEDAGARDLSARDQTWMVVSAMYGTAFIVIFGICLPLVAQFSAIHRNPRLSFFKFFDTQVMAYVIGISFFIFVFVYRQWQKRDSSRMSITLFTNREKPKRAVFINETGSFYLRVGGMVFCLGCIILVSLQLGWAIQISTTGTQCTAHIDGLIAHYALLIVYFTLHCYFVFENSKLCLTRFRPLIQMGVMHIVVTDLSIWLWHLRDETFFEMAEEYNHLTHGAGGDHAQDTDHETVYKRAAAAVAPGGSHSDNVSGGHGTGIEGQFCGFFSDIEGYELLEKCSSKATLGKVVVVALPYLYPCVIEFALIGASIMFVIWMRQGRPQRVKADQAGGQQQQQAVPKHKDLTLDVNEAMSATSKGLFSGSIFIVSTILSLILYNSFVDTTDSELGMILAQSNELALNVVTLIAIVIAWFKMSKLKRIKAGPEASLDSSLLYFTLNGQQLFYIITLIGSMHYIGEETIDAATLWVSVLNASVGFFQATLQTVFCGDMARRRAHDDRQAVKKPGRELVTFLLVTNYALWAVNVFQNQKIQFHPIQIDFYGIENWIMLTRICQPLAIFFRFHSTVCLVDVWSEAYHHLEH